MPVTSGSLPRSPFPAIDSSYGSLRSLLPTPHSTHTPHLVPSEQNVRFYDFGSPLSLWEALMIQSSRIYTPFFKFKEKLAVVNKAYLNSKTSAYKARFPTICETRSQRRFSVAPPTLAESLA